MTVLSSAGAQVPVIPLLDVAGNAVIVVPEQIGATAVKVGVILGLTVMVRVAVVAHCPTVGVNVYVVVAVLSSAGVHVPVTPLLDVVGNGANTAPEQMGATALKVVVIFGLTTIVNVVVVAHCPAVGVKVYVVVAVLFKAGAQIPVILLLDVVGNAVSVAPEQIGAAAVNVGAMFGLTVMVKTVVVAH